MHLEITSFGLPQRHPSLHLQLAQDVVVLARELEVGLVAQRFEGWAAHGAMNRVENRDAKRARLQDAPVGIRVGPRGAHVLV